MAGIPDARGRRARKLRISVTDRCNLRCRYCMPADFTNWLPREQILSFDEITELAGIFSQLGVRRFRLTGGEPLVRREVERLVRALAALPALEDLAMTTNGVLLEQKARALREAGLRRLNVSLDSLSRERYRRMTGRDALPAVLRGLKAAREAGFREIRINTVLIRGWNAEEAERMVWWANEEGFLLRFIEFMPFGGPEPWSQDAVVTMEELLRRFRKKGPIFPVAREEGATAHWFHWEVRGRRLRFGVIPTISAPFCVDCDRLRLSATGLLQTCLFGERRLNLRKLLRDGTSEAEIAEAIRDFVWGKEEGVVAGLRRKEVTMNTLGG